jgi:hypothetical protein
MNGKALRPETLIELQIHLDRLNHTAEACRSALVSLRGGQMTHEAYRELLDRQVVAQREWEAKNHEHLGFGD